MTDVVEKYLSMDQPPVDLSKLPASNVIRNFLCRYLYEDDLLISYAPSRALSSSKTFRWLMGAHVCHHDTKNNTIEIREKMHFSTVKLLLEAGLLKVRKDVRAPHLKCIIFGWSNGVKRRRRQLLVSKAFGDSATPRPDRVQTIAALYGLQVKFTSLKGLFEVLKGNNGEALSIEGANRTYIFMNKAGEPVTRWTDMSLAEWEESLHRMASDGGCLGSPLKSPEGCSTHLEMHRV